MVGTQAVAEPAHACLRACRAVPCVERVERRADVWGRSKDNVYINRQSLSIFWSYVAYCADNHRHSLWAYFGARMDRTQAYRIIHIIYDRYIGEAL